MYLLWQNSFFTKFLMWSGFREDVGLASCLQFVLLSLHSVSWLSCLGQSRTVDLNVMWRAMSLTCSKTTSFFKEISFALCTSYKSDVVPSLSGVWLSIVHHLPQYIQCGINFSYSRGNLDLWSLQLLVLTFGIEVSSFAIMQTHSSSAC